MFEGVRYQIGRFMNAAQRGLRFAYHAYRDEESSIDSDYFDTYEARMGRYHINTLYEEGKQYRPTNMLRNSARFTGRYRHIRNIYNFIGRLVDLEVNKVYGGRIDWPGDLATGAIPIEVDAAAHPMLITSIKKILRWSNFGRQKDLYVRNGARLGDSFLKIIPVFDVTENGMTPRKVRIEVLDPHKVKDVKHNESGDVIWICIEYEDIDDAGKDFLYREEISKFDIKIYRDDELMSTTENTYGFVPVVHALHKNVGRKWGITSFHNSLEKLDERNDVASVTNDGIRKGVNPMLKVKGGKLPSPNAEARDRDGLLVFELPKADMDIEPITPQIDAPGSLATQESMKKEAESDAPQTSLQSIRDNTTEISGRALALSYADAGDAIEAIQGNYDEALLRAIQMGCTIGGVMGLEDFPYDLDSYENGELDFYILERKVFADQIDKEARARLLIDAAQSPVWPIVARDLEVSEEDIELVLNDGRERQALQTAAAIRGLMQGAGMDEETEEGEIVEDEGDEQLAE